MDEGSIVERCRRVFRDIKDSFDKRQSSIDRLSCEQGIYKNCAVLKLRKASWTNDRIDVMQSRSGLFFSIWIDEDAAKRSRAHYNIHALKLRHLKGYSITSRQFADDFRRDFEAMHDAWPNLRVDYGPLTLMQGWIEIDLNNLEKDILPLMERFAEVSPLIDNLLAVRRR